jgi:hypothetical protein
MRYKLRTLLIVLAAILCISHHCGGDDRIVARVTLVTFTIDTTVPPSVHLHAIGESPVKAFAGKLVRVNHEAPPKDGIQDFFLMATPGSGESARDTVATSYTWTSATRDAPWLVGIRIHGADGSVTKMLPLR